MLLRGTTCGVRVVCRASIFVYSVQAHKRIKEFFAQHESIKVISKQDFINKETNA